VPRSAQVPGSGMGRTPLVAKAGIELARACPYGGNCPRAHDFNDPRHLGC
jgi:hypothetical protein